MKEKRVRQVCLDESDSENLENLAPNSKRQAFKSSKLKEHADSMQSVSRACMRTTSVLQSLDTSLNQVKSSQELLKVHGETKMPIITKNCDISTEIGIFKVIKKIGSGCFGIVYAVKNKSEIYALKVNFKILNTVNLSCMIFLLASCPASVTVPFLNFRYHHPLTVPSNRPILDDAVCENQ